MQSNKKNKKPPVFQVGDYAYYVHFPHKGNSFVPIITQVKVVKIFLSEYGEGNNGYEVVLPTSEYKELNPYTQKLNEKTLHIGDVGLELLASRKEAKAYSKKLVAAQILSLKEQQAVISRNLNRFHLYQNHQPFYNHFDLEESK